MNNKLIIFTTLIGLVLLFGCVGPKEMIWLPAAGNINVDTGPFNQEITISENEIIILEGVYAKITTDNVQIRKATHTATVFGGVLASKVTFLGSDWIVNKLNCETGELSLINSKGSISFQGKEYVGTGPFISSISCENEKLNSISLTLSKSIPLTEGELISIKYDDFGYSLEYVGKGRFLLRN